MILRGRRLGCKEGKNDSDDRRMGYREVGNDDNSWRVGLEKLGVMLSVAGWDIGKKGVVMGARE